jgi:hypothetical protein
MSINYSAVSVLHFSLCDMHMRACECTQTLTDTCMHKDFPEIVRDLTYAEEVSNLHVSWMNWLSK